MDPNPGNEDHKKQAALHHACMGGSVDCARILLKYGADVNQSDKVWNLKSEKYVTQGFGERISLVFCLDCMFIFSKHRIFFCWHRASLYK